MRKLFDGAAAEKPSRALKIEKNNRWASGTPPRAQLGEPTTFSRRSGYGEEKESRPRFRPSGLRLRLWGLAANASQIIPPLSPTPDATAVSVKAVREEPTLVAVELVR